jgi:3-deoxy-D-manno-octulosonic-acid transferase
MLSLYRTLTRIAAPLLPLWLWRRARHGKEDTSRWRERFGYASLPRPEGPLLWVHAASVGESQMALPLIERLLATYPAMTALITTGTVTSAALLARRPVPRLLHQYMPVDTPAAVARFLRHWQPDLACWMESEFWPNMLQQTAAQCPMMLLNGRISARSASRWARFPAAARTLMGGFRLLLAASEDDAARLRQLGGADVRALGNLKFSSPPLAHDAAALALMREETTGRVVWLAASTHPGEERQIAEVHQALAARHPGLLTVVVPRHPQRAAAIMEELEALGLRVARRSQREPIVAATQIYLADTMGELGLFFRLCPVAFIGGSLVPHGGQNPFEAARLGTCVLYGPHMHNFTDFCSLLEAAEASQRVASGEALSGAVDALLRDTALRQARSRAGQAVVDAQATVEARVWEAITPLCRAQLSAGPLSEGDR